MSAGLIVVIVVGGTVVVLAGVGVLLMWVRRRVRSHQPPPAEETLRVMEQRGWRFAERDDSVVPLYDRQQYDYRNRSPAAAMLAAPPHAKAAYDVITGNHRGRSFVAATFDAVYQGNRSRQRVIWVATPGTHPYLRISRIYGPQNAVNAAIGRGGIQLGFPEFDKKFEVICADPSFAQAVLSPDVVELLLNDQRQFRGVSLYGEAIDIVDPVGDHRDPDELMTALDFRCDILDRIPDHAWTSPAS